MMVSDEEKRWLVVGIAMNKVAAPVLRNFIKQGMNTHYTNMDVYCSGLATPCTLKTLTYHQVSTNPCFEHLKFQNINNNLQLYGMKKKDLHKYNYNINSSVDLAKLFLPDYLAEFSGFDNSLDMSAILRLLGFNKPAPIFHSPNPLISIQLLADEVRENVRNTWGHCNVTDWNEVFFNDCFSKLETLVRGLGLTSAVEKMALDQLSDWETKGCQLCMGHAVDQNLLSFVQQDVKELVKRYKSTDESLAKQRVELTEMQDQQSATRAQLEDHDDQLTAVLEWKEQQMKENKEILLKLMSVEKILTEELLIRVEGVEKGLVETNEKVQQLEQGFAKTDDKVEQLQQGFAKTDDKVEQLQQGFAQTDDKVEQLQQGFAKTDDKVEQLQQGFAKTDNKVEQLQQGFANKVKQLQQGFAKTDDKVEQLQQGFAKAEDKVEQLVQGFAKTDDKVEQLQQGFAKTDDKVEQLQQGFANKVEQLQQGFAQTDDKVEQLQQGFAQTDDKVEQLQQGFAKTDDKVEQLQQGFANKVKQLQQGFAKTDDKVEQLQQGFAKTDDKVEQLQEGFAEVVSETGNKVKQLEEALRSQRMKENKPEACPADMFYVKTCQKKLAERYQKTAKVPTTAWFSVYQVDLEKIYTRLSWVKQEQTTAGSSQKELNHYTDIFTEKTANGVVAKRILVQGETGIGKTTFVKKLLVDWSNLEEAKMDEERKDALRKFDLIVSINLKEVSKCQTFKEVITRSRLFPEDDERSVDDLLCYIRANQDKVLLVFDGYDEYRTGSEADERFGSRSSSPIFEIFLGNIFRECTVLVTTRISRADEIRLSADIQAEITGFNMPDREDFMRKMLDSQTEVDELLDFLFHSNMEHLARVPLLNLFFCLLWKKEKQKLTEFTERKAKLYEAMVKHILQHSHQRHSSSKASKLKETDYEEILAEIGKVALAGLLKGDLVFDFGQLPEKVRGEEGVIVGLFQFSEYGPSLEPKEMVSFIHKSIQEYLAAWYLIYSCVPKGSLGEIEQHARTLENCEALKNVFQFVCGLSDEGAKKVLEHLTSVRISDATLDLSKTIPDVETETEVPVCDVTVRHERFSNLVYDSFKEAQSKAGLLSQCLDCTGGVVLVTRDMLLSELIPDVNVLIELARNCVFILGEICFDLEGEDSIVYKTLEFLDCLQLPVRISENSDVLKVEDLIRKLRFCPFRAILCLRYGRFHFYITELFLGCDDRARPFTESISICVPSDAASMCSQQSCLKFLTSFVSYRNLSEVTVKALGAVIRGCKHLYTIGVEDAEESICYLLEQVQNPSKCSLIIATCFIHPDVDHTSTGAVKLASLLPKFNNIIFLYLDVRDCCAAALDTLVSGISHKSVEKLTLSKIRLTPAVAEALGRSLPEMSSLQELRLCGMDGTVLQAKEMKALFGGFNKRLPLHLVTLSSFSEISCLAPFNESLRFFPDLRALHLDKLNIDDQDLCVLLESWRFVRNMTELRVWAGQPGGVHCFPFWSPESLTVNVVNLTSTVATTLGRIIPEMSSLQTLSLTAADGSILQTKELGALFLKLNKPLPLYQLNIRGYNVRGSLAPLIKSLRFFPNLTRLELYKLNMAEDDQCGLLESLKFIPHLTSLRIQSKPLAHGDCSKPILELTSHSSALRTSKNLNLHGLSLTPATLASLGRSLPEMSSLETLELTGYRDERNLPAEGTKALFGGLSKILPLSKLRVFPGFNVTGSIAPLTNSFCFFPKLVQLCLAGFNMDKHNLCGLVASLHFIPKLMELAVYGGDVTPTHCCAAEENPVSGFTHEALRELELIDIDLTPEVALVLGRLLPEMLSLQNLRLVGLYRNVLKTEEMEALFGGFNKTLPLVKLTLSGFSAIGCLGPLVRSFRFFPNLEQLYLEGFLMDEHNLCALLESVGFIPNLKKLSVIGQTLAEAHRCTKKVNTMASITHKTLEELKLDRVSLTPITDGLLAGLLPEMLSLQTLELTGVEEVQALFGFNVKWPLYRLTSKNFSLKGCLATLCNSFHSFPNLKSFKLTRLNMSERDQCSLLESLRFIPSVRALSVKSKHHDQGIARRRGMQDRFSSFTLEARERLHLDGVSLTPAAAAALGQSLPEMASLKVLQLTGVSGSILQAEHIEALFGRFKKTMPLCELTLSGFSVRGSLSPLIKSLHFFSSLKELKLKNLAIGEKDQCGLLKSFGGIIRDLTKLGVCFSGAKCLDSTHYDTSELKAVVSHASGRVDLDGISLTSAVTAVLGQLLHEMASLQNLRLRGLDGSILEAEEMEALFGRFNKPMPLCSITFSGFSMRGFFAPLNNSLRFFPSLKVLDLSMLNMDEHDLRGLLESFQCIPNLHVLNLSGNPLGHAVTSIVPHVINLKKLRNLWIDGTGLSEEDLTYVLNTVKQALPDVEVEVSYLPMFRQLYII